MKSYKLITAIAVASFGSFGLSQAAIDVAAGFPTYNTDVAIGAPLSGLTPAYGSFDGNVGFAAWEYFKGTSFSNLGSQYSAGAFGLNATLSHSASGNVIVAGPAIDVGGESYNGRLGNGPYDFSIDAIAQKAITSVTIQIKHTPFMDADFNTQLAFVPTLSYGGNVYAYSSVIQGPYLSNFSDPLTTMNMTNHVYSYTWDNLDIEAAEAFLINFASLEDQLGFGFSVDSIALHVVPEPSTYALLLGLGAGVVVFVRRRRAVAA